MLSSRRNPYVILGVDFGSDVRSANRAFARASKRIRREEKPEFDSTDLTWALHQIEHAEVDHASLFSVFRVPANPAAFVLSDAEGALAVPVRRLERRTESTIDRDLQKLRTQSVRESIAAIAAAARAAGQLSGAVVPTLVALGDDDADATLWSSLEPVGTTTPAERLRGRFGKRTSVAAVVVGILILGVLVAFGARGGSDSVVTPASGGIIETSIAVTDVHWIKTSGTHTAILTLQVRGADAKVLRTGNVQFSVGEDVQRQPFELQAEARDQPEQGWRTLTIQDVTLGAWRGLLTYTSADGRYASSVNELTLYVPGYVKPASGAASGPKPTQHPKSVTAAPSQKPSVRPTPAKAEAGYKRPPGYRSVPGFSDMGYALYDLGRAAEGGYEGIANVDSGRSCSLWEAVFRGKDANSGGNVTASAYQGDSRNASAAIRVGKRTDIRFRFEADSVEDIQLKSLTCL